jgi:invasion protein IalB
MAQSRFEGFGRWYKSAIVAAALIVPVAAAAQGVGAPPVPLTPAPAAPAAPAPAAPAATVPAAPGPAAPAGAGAAAAPEGAAPAWVKVCAKEENTEKELCQVIQQMTADTGQFIASVNLQRLEGEPKMRFAAAISMVGGGLVVRPGLRVQIDDHEQHELSYSVCYPDHCFADMEADETFVAEMKAGGKLTLVVLTQDRGTVAFPPLTLIGFTRAYDGPGIDPAAAQARIDALSASLAAHAEEARQRLIDQQGAAAGTPTPAPAPAPVP